MGGGFPGAFGGGPTGATQPGVAMMVELRRGVHQRRRHATDEQPADLQPAQPGQPRRLRDNPGRELQRPVRRPRPSPQRTVVVGKNIGWLANGDWTRYDGVNFGASAATQFVARSPRGPRVASAV